MPAAPGSAAGGTWLRLKCCPAPDCGRPFYDDSGRSACPVHGAG